MTYAGAIGGSGSLSKLGQRHADLTGNNSYTGTTTLSAGTLSIGNGGSGEFLASPTIADSGAC